MSQSKKNTAIKESSDWYVKIDTAQNNFTDFPKHLMAHKKLKSIEIRRNSMI